MATYPAVATDPGLRTAQAYIGNGNKWSKTNALKGQAAFSKVVGSTENFFDKGEKALRTTHASSILALVLTSCSPPVVCIAPTTHSY